MLSETMLAIETGPGVFTLCHHTEAGTNQSLYEELSALTAEAQSSGGFRADRIEASLVGGSPHGGHRGGTRSMPPRTDGIHGTRVLLRDIPEALLGECVRYSDILGLYLLRPTGVEVYVPVWCLPDLLRPLREHLSVAVYPADAVPTSPADSAALQRREGPYRPDRAEYVIDHSTIPPTGLPDPGVADILRDNLDAIWAVQEVAASLDSYAVAPGEPLGIASTEYYHLLVSGPDQPILPDSIGMGLLVGLDDPADYSAVIDVAARHRFAISVSLAARESVSVDDVSSAIVAFVDEVVTAVPGRVAPFSPSPFKEIADASLAGESVQIR